MGRWLHSMSAKCNYTISIIETTKKWHKIATWEKADQLMHSDLSKWQGVCFSQIYLRKKWIEVFVWVNEGVNLKRVALPCRRWGKRGKIYRWVKVQFAVPRIDKKFLFVASSRFQRWNSIILHECGGGIVSLIAVSINKSKSLSLTLLKLANIFFCTQVPDPWSALKARSD